VAPPPFQTLVRPPLAFPTGPLFPVFSSVFPGTVPPVTRAPSLIWRGTASDVLSEDPKKTSKKLNEEVEKMFKKFLPKS
jgi:hypothetical protein